MFEQLGPRQAEGVEEVVVEAGQFPGEDGGGEGVGLLHGAGVVHEEGEGQGAVEDVGEGEEGAGWGGEGEEEEGGDELGGISQRGGR